MAILVETMRREGFELTVGRPEVIVKDIDGEKMEPIEELSVDCDESFMGVVTENWRSARAACSTASITAAAVSA